MDISLVAKMKKYDEFISCYNEGDEKKVYKGKSLLYYFIHYPIMIQKVVI